ncbi:MAG: SMI1/KNR4 family protein, partial [Bacteroidota bacterium]
MEDKDFASVPSEMIEEVWLGYPGATNEEISAAENRLGLTLPPSYKNFLNITNGWQVFDSLFGGLCPIQEVEYYATKHQDLIDAWNHGVEMGGGLTPISDEEYFVYGSLQESAVFRQEYLQSAIKIGGDENNGTILLNPE